MARWSVNWQRASVKYGVEIPLSKSLRMNLEINKPELVQRMNARIQTGQFQDTDDLIEKALDALDEKRPRRPLRPATAPPAGKV